jgi:hypothetical protein
LGAVEADMTLPAAEIPRESSRLGAGHMESLPRITNLNRGLYALVLYLLGIALLLLIGGWIFLTAIDRVVPEAVPVVIATIVGALVGVIAADKSSA